MFGNPSKKERIARAQRDLAEAQGKLAEEAYLTRVREEERLKFERDKFNEEKYSKDRADVSLNDHIALLKENESLKQRLSVAEGALKKITQPVYDVLEGEMQLSNERISATIQPLRRGNCDAEDALSMISEGYCSCDAQILSSNPCGDIFNDDVRVCVIYKISRRDIAMWKEKHGKI